MEQDNRAGPHLPGHPRTHTVDRVVLRRFRNHAPLDHLQALARKQCKRLVRTSAVRQAEQRYGFRQLDAAPFRPSPFQDLLAQQLIFRLRPADLLQHGLFAHNAEIAMRPPVIADLKKRIGHKLHGPLAVGPHPLAAHEQGGGDPLLTQEIDDFSIVSCSHGGQFAQIKRQGRHFFLGGHAAYGAFILNRKRRKNLFGNRAFRRSGIVGNGVPGVLGQKAWFGMPQRRRPCRKSQRNHNQTTDNDLVQHEKNLMC